MNGIWKDEQINEEILIWEKNHILSFFAPKLEDKNFLCQNYITNLEHVMKTISHAEWTDI